MRESQHPAGAEGLEISVSAKGSGLGVVAGGGGCGRICVNMCSPRKTPLLGLSRGRGKMVNPVEGVVDHDTGSEIHPEERRNLSAACGDGGHIEAVDMNSCMAG